MIVEKQDLFAVGEILFFFTDFERFKNTFFRMNMAVVKRGARH